MDERPFDLDMPVESQHLLRQMLASGAPANDLVGMAAAHPVAAYFTSVAIGQTEDRRFALMLLDHAGHAYGIAEHDTDDEIYAEWLSVAMRLGLPRYCFVEGGIAVPFDSAEHEAYPRRRAHVLAKRRPRFLAMRKQATMGYVDCLTPTTPDKRTSGR